MNGKEKCEFLKGIRKRIAEANGIPYEPRECTYQGECTGTCPFCEKEAAELLAKLKEKEAEGTEIKTDEVCILAIELGINESKGSNEGDNYNTVLTGAEDTLVELNTETSTSNIDPFRGANNPFISGKGLQEMRQYIHREREPYMGDIRSPLIEELRKEEMQRIMEEQMRPTMGHVEEWAQEKEK